MVGENGVAAGSLRTEIQGNINQVLLNVINAKQHCSLVNQDKPFSRNCLKDFLPIKAISYAV